MMAVLLSRDAVGDERGRQALVERSIIAGRPRRACSLSTGEAIMATSYALNALGRRRQEDCLIRGRCAARFAVATARRLGQSRAIAPTNEDTEQKQVAHVYLSPVHPTISRGHCDREFSHNQHRPPINSLEGKFAKSEHNE
jgi:hypothetical protein